MNFVRKICKNLVIRPWKSNVNKAIVRMWLKTMKVVKELKRKKTIMENSNLSGTSKN